MIKAVAGPTVFLGLSRRNTELLLEGKPIRVRLSELGMPTDVIVVVLAGETEQDIVKTLEAAGMKMPPLD